MWMNEYEIDRLVVLLEDEDDNSAPNALRGAKVLQRLMRWTNDHSDGWPYWKKPSNAADRLMSHLHEVEVSLYRGTVDMTDAELDSALRPIKAFLTRQVNGGGSTELECLEILEGPQAESQHILSVVLVQSEIDALLTLSSNSGLSPSAWIARQISTAVA